MCLTYPVFKCPVARPPTKGCRVLLGWPNLKPMETPTYFASVQTPATCRTARTHTSCSDYVAVELSCLPSMLTRLSAIVAPPTTYAYTYIYVYTHIHTYISLSICVYIYIYIYIYTHIDVNTWLE